MRPLRTFGLLAALGLLIAAPAHAGDGKGELTDQQFGRILTMFLEDLLHEKGKEVAKLVVMHTMKMPNAAVMTGLYR